jgi:hypothetical protein
MIYEFGSGVLTATQSYNLAGSATANPTPRLFGAVQDVNFDLAFSKKELYGMFIFPLAVARGTAKVDCKAKCAGIYAEMFNDIFFGETLNVGQTIMSFQEAWTVPSTPFQVTVQQSATYASDLGVIYSATGLPLTRVSAIPTTGAILSANVDSSNQGTGYAVGNVLTVTGGGGSGATYLVTSVSSGAVTGILQETAGTGYSVTSLCATTVSPSGGTGCKIDITGVGAAGQYSVNTTTGVYTFNSADATKGVLISYNYTTSTSPAANFVINNRLLGQSPFFSITFNIAYQGNNMQMQLYQCISTKLTMGTKLEDFLIPEFDFSAMANSANQVGAIFAAQ